MNAAESGTLEDYYDSPAPMLVRESSRRKLLHANPAACRYYGYSLEQIQGLPPLAFYPPAAHAYIQTFFDNEEDDEIANFHTIHVTAGGEERGVHLSVSNFAWKGKPAQLILVRDQGEPSSVLHRVRGASASTGNARDSSQPAFDANPTPMFVIDKKTRLFVDANQAACNYYGYARDEFTKIGPADFYTAKQRTALSAQLALIESPESVDFATVHIKGDGTPSDVHVSLTPVQWNGRPASLASVHDVSTGTVVRLTAGLPTETLAESEAIIASMKSHSDVFKRAQRVGKFGDWSIDLRTNAIYWSEGLFRLLGRSKELGVPGGLKPHRRFYSATDFKRLEEMQRRTLAGIECDGEDFEIVRPDQSTLWVRQEMTAEFDRGGAAIRLLGSLHDISAHKDVEAKLETQARLDALTGLPNRKAAVEALKMAIATAQRTDLSPAVLFIDIDDFKRINETLGHSAGDDLLVRVSERLRLALHTYDFLARMGDDEFVVILADVQDRAAASAVAHNLQRSLTDPIEMHARHVVITASIGIASYPHDGLSAEALIMNSDTAMYHGKRQERGSHRFFSSEMHAAAEEKLQLDVTMRESIRTKGFTVHYQPIVAPDGRIVACEALARWPQPAQEMLLPGTFIPYAEESGLIIPLGRFVLATACAQGAEWNSLPGVRLRMSVNVSAKQIADPTFVQDVFDELATSGLAPDLLELEFTETLIAHSPEQSRDVALQLRAAGIRIALDDFGTGYNSLVNLRTLQIDTLKLDRCFVEDIVESTIDRAIASAVISAARTLGAIPLAEGVETAEQSAILMGLGIDEMQGYLFARPMSPGDMEQFMDRANRNPVSLRPTVAA